MDGLPLGTCDSTLLLSLEGFIDGAVVGKFEGLLLGYWIGSVVELVCGFNEGTELVFWDMKVLDRTLGDMVGL